MKLCYTENKASTRTSELFSISMFLSIYYRRYSINVLLLLFRLLILFYLKFACIRVRSQRDRLKYVAAASNCFRHLPYTNLIDNNLLLLLIIIIITTTIIIFLK